MVERRLTEQGDNTYLTAGNNAEARSGDLERIREQSHAFNIHTNAFYERLNSLGLGKKARVLVDFGTGTGGSLPILASYAKHIIATDIEPEKIEAGKRFVKAEGLNQTTTFDFPLGGIASLNLKSGSVDIVNGRLIWQHLNEEVRSNEMRAAVLALKPGGLFVAEDMNLHTWNLQPSTETFSWFLRKLIELYGIKGTEAGMGPKLRSLCEDNGLEVVAEDSYVIESRADDSFKNIHLGIFMAAQAGLINEERGVMSAKQFSEGMVQLRKDVLDATRTIYAPQMTQIAARKK